MQTALHQAHLDLGASFTDFGGWDMPVRYTNELAEHAAVRTSAGLFDISHMAEIFVAGADAAAFLDHALVNPASAIAVGRAKYSLICAPYGGVIDDLIVYRLADDEFLVVANAGNRHNVVAALNERTDDFANLSVSDQSDDWALIAIQGPKALGILQQVCSAPLAEQKYYSIQGGVIAGVNVLLCRTGYTGEDGFEVLAPVASARQIWDLLLATGGPDLLPCGLACRDTLRLEAGMPLYGQELDLGHAPQEAGLGRSVVLEREGNGKFVGQDALKVASEASVPMIFGRRKQVLIGLRGDGRRAARHGYEVFYPGEDKPIGVVTSGALSPTLGYPIAMAYVQVENQPIEPGTVLEVDIRGNRQEFQVCPMPFYKRAK
jgi:aminomethyltransferase